MFHFIHTADWHIDLNPSVPRWRKDLQMAAVALFVDKAVTRSDASKLDAIFICGDIFDSHDPGEETKSFFLTCLKRLVEKGIPVWIIPGNHDTFSKDSTLSAFASLGIVQNLTLMGSAASQTSFNIITRPCSSGLFHNKYRLFFLPWMESKSYMLNLKKFKVKTEEIGILITHQMMIGSMLPSGFVTDVGILPDSFERFRYVALGDVHKRQDFSVDRHTTVRYPGSLYCNNFGERREGKGFLDVYITDALSVSTEFAEVGTCRFKVIKISINLLEKFLKNKSLAKKSLGRKVLGNIIRLIINCRFAEPPNYLIAGSVEIADLFKQMGVVYFECEFSNRMDVSVKKKRFKTKNPKKMISDTVDSSSELAQAEKVRLKKLGKKVYDSEADK